MKSSDFQGKRHVRSSSSHRPFFDYSGEQGFFSKGRASKPAPFFKPARTGQFRSLQQHQQGVIQRTIEVAENLRTEVPALYKAILKFHEIESQDLTQDEFNLLKAGRNRFMPLLGRFSMAKNTNLKITTGDSEGSELATTTLVVISGNKEFDYDAKDANNIKQMLETGYSGKDSEEIKFEVRITFKKGNRSTQVSIAQMQRGHYLQAFTHEMTIHAENMLDLIEDYWEGIGRVLPTADAEHLQYLEGQVKRYEYMRYRVQGEKESYKHGFNDQESLDKRALENTQEVMEKREARNKRGLAAKKTPLHARTREKENIKNDPSKDIIAKRIAEILLSDGIIIKLNTARQLNEIVESDDNYWNFNQLRTALTQGLSPEAVINAPEQSYLDWDDD